MEVHSPGSRDFRVGGCGRTGGGDRRAILRELPRGPYTVPDDAPITAVSEGVRGYALDPHSAEALWKKSEELVGESF